MIYINITKSVLISSLEKDHSMIETRRLKNVIIFIQTILNFVVSREIIKQDKYFSALYAEKPLFVFQKSCI